MAKESVAINPFEPEDLGGVVSLINRELHADPVSSDIFQRKVLLDINFRQEGAQVAKIGGRVVGFMLGMVRKQPLEDGPADGDRGWITLMAVDGEFQRKGIGSALLQRVTEYLKTNGAKWAWVSPYAPNYFCPGVDEAAYPGAIEFLKKHGFETILRPLSMDASLIGLETPNWVKEKEAALLREGVVLDTFRPEHILPILDFLKREFAGDWQRYVRETMARITQGTFAPDQLFAAMEKGRCIGFCQHDGERFGPFGVEASQRGRGIGAVLLFRCLHGMRAKGLHNAWFLWTDDKVARLYSQAGFRETRRYALMRREL